MLMTIVNGISMECLDKLGSKNASDTSIAAFEVFFLGGAA
jgi:hypothetical protein